MGLLVDIVQWTNNIHDIFERNASQFETLKNQFEEHLGNVTKKLSQDIDSLLPKLTIIDDMHDTDKLRQYKMILDDYSEQIECFEEYIGWINKEEKLFKLTVTQYPIVAEIKNYIQPFAVLIT